MTDPEDSDNDVQIQIGSCLFTEIKEVCGQLDKKEFRSKIIAMNDNESKKIDNMRFTLFELAKQDKRMPEGRLSKRKTIGNTSCQERLAEDIYTLFHFIDGGLGVDEVSSVLSAWERRKKLTSVNNTLSNTSVLNVTLSQADMGSTPGSVTDDNNSVSPESPQVTLSCDNTSAPSIDISNTVRALIELRETFDDKLAKIKTDIINDVIIKVSDVIQEYQDSSVDITELRDSMSKTIDDLKDQNVLLKSSLKLAKQQLVEKDNELDYLKKQIVGKLSTVDGKMQSIDTKLGNMKQMYCNKVSGSPEHSYPKAIRMSPTQSGNIDKISTQAVNVQGNSAEKQLKSKIDEMHSILRDEYFSRVKNATIEDLEKINEKQVQQELLYTMNKKLQNTGIAFLNSFDQLLLTAAASSLASTVYTASQKRLDQHTAQMKEQRPISENVSVQNNQNSETPRGKTIPVRVTNNEINTSGLEANNTNTTEHEARQVHQTKSETQQIPIATDMKKIPVRVTNAEKNTCGFEGAQPKQKVSRVVLTRVKADRSQENIQKGIWEYCNERGVTVTFVRFLKKWDTPEPLYTIRVNVLRDHYDSVLQDNFWPHFVHCRPWYTENEYKKHRDGDMY